MIIDVYFLILPNMMALDIVGPAETLKLAGEQFNIIYVGYNDAERCSTGILVGDLKPLPTEIQDGSFIVLSGVSNSLVDFDNPESEMAKKWIIGFKSKVDEGKISVICICSGALLAGKVGLLDGRNCTTHHEILNRLKTCAPKAFVKDNLLFVEDRGVYTCAGIMAGIDLALSLVRVYCGNKTSMKVAREMIVYFPRAGTDSQNSPWLKFRHHHHPVIHRAQDVIISNLREKWPLDKLSKEVYVSPRHLSRLFKQYLNISVKEYQEQMQLILFDKYIKQEGNLERSSYLSGFSSVRQLRRVQKKVSVMSS